MKVDASLLVDLADVPAKVRELEGLGYDGVVSLETDHDVFCPLVLAAEHSQRVELLTGVAIALARTPMTVAYVANDLQRYSRGRFVLGLGSQIKAHVEKRFGMPWSHPAARMREFVLALRAIWRSWETGERLAFRGDFYTHTLMTPFFAPRPHGFGQPRVLLGGLGSLMVETAAEVADGVIVHPMVTERYVREKVLAAVERGLARGGRSRRDFEVCLSPFVVSGRDESEVAAAREVVRQQIAFYASTPQYRVVLELHGWEAAQDELNRLSKEGRWGEMPAVVDDGMLAAFAVEAQPDRLAEAIAARFAGVADRLSFMPTWPADPADLGGLVAALRAIETGASRAQPRPGA